MMWKDLHARGTPSVCCSGQELPGWMASGVLPHKDPLYKSLLSVSWRPQTPCSSRAEPSSFTLWTITLSPGEGPAQEVWPNRPHVV